MKREPPAEGRHLADRRSPSTGTRAAEFLRLSREKREGFHASRPAAGTDRVAHFLRIARGKLA